MKKKVMIFFALIVGTIASAQNLRESIAIVRPNFSESTQTFLTDFSKSLRKDGFYAAADILQITGKGRSGPDLPTGINETVGYTSSPTVMW